MIAQLYYKQKRKPFTKTTNCKFQVNIVHCMFSSFSIQHLYILRFHPTLYFNFKDLANYFCEFFVIKSKFVAQKSISVIAIIFFLVEHSILEKL